MNSSIKPPTSSRKFNFDLDFEMEEERVRLELMRQEELARYVADTPAPVQFSEDQLTRAREESYQLGFDQGLSDARKEIEQNLSEILQHVIFKLDSMLTEENARWETAQRLAIATVIATLKKFWPQLLQQLGAQVVEDTIRQSLELNNAEPRIVVRVHDSVLDAVVNRLPHLKEQEAFAGKVIVLADEHVAIGDCKVEWADGGMERLARTLSMQMDDALNRILAAIPKERPATPTQQPETERMSS